MGQTARDMLGEIRKELKQLEECAEFNQHRLSESLRRIEDSIPPAFALVFQLEDPSKRKEFWTAVAEWTTDVSVMQSCGSLFRLIALLKMQPDQLESVPQLTEEVETGHRSACAGRTSLRGKKTDIDDYIEHRLSILGHVHEETLEGMRKGNLEASKADGSWAGIVALRNSCPEFYEWVIVYLAIRLIRNLVNFDLFYIMHGNLPRYRELKIATYLLMLLGRGKYALLSAIVKVAHDLYHDILLDCGRAFRAEAAIEELQAKVAIAVSATDRKMREIGKRVPKPGEDLHALIVRLFYRFFSHYIAELAEAGQLHMLLWALPMFREVKAAFQSIEVFGGRGLSVLIIGETGTGKESIAKLFLKSKGEPYVVVNCAGVSWEAITKDLFCDSGDSLALVRNVGALFLDEVDKSHLDTQGGLLRLLDKPVGEYRPPGKLMPLQWNGLVIASATENIYDKISSGQFLPDLFWRFDIRATISPLKEMTRTKEIFEELLRLVLERARRKFNIPKKIKILQSQMQRLGQYTWPGNLRELLEMADALMVSVKRSALMRSEDTGNEIELDESTFNRVFAQFEEIRNKLAPTTGPLTSA